MPVIGNTTNEYGTPVRRYECESCGEEFTVCPVPMSDEGWRNCLSEDCPSYDPERDVDSLFDGSDETGRRVVKEERSH